MLIRSPVTRCPTEHWTIPRPPKPLIDVSELHKGRRTEDFEALKLRNVRSEQKRRDKRHLAVAGSRIMRDRFRYGDVEQLLKINTCRK